MGIQSSSRKVFLLCVTAMVCLLHASALGDQLTVRAHREALSSNTQDSASGIRLKFNHPVFPSDLTNSTTITANGGGIGFSILIPGTQDPATNAAREFVLVPTGVEEGATSLTLAIHKGLSEAAGRRRLTKDYSSEFIWKEPISLSDVTTFFSSDTEKGVGFMVSGPISERDLFRALAITPTVAGLRIYRMSDRRFRIAGDFVYDEDYTLKVSRVSGDTGKAEFVPSEFTFKGPGIKPNIAFKSERSVVELKGRQLVPLNLARVNKVRCGLVRVPPALIPEAAQAIRAGETMDKVKLDEMASKLKGSPDAAKLGTAFIGETSTEAEVFFANQAKGSTNNYSLSLSFRKNPGHGGAWITSLTDPDGVFKSESTKLIQVTDLSISYKLSEKTLLLWLTSIHSGQPVANVRMVLFCDESSYKFIGKTNQDGLLLVKDGQVFPSIGSEESSQQPLDLGKVTWVVAATEHDACTIELNSVQLKPFAVQQAAKAREKPDGRTGRVFTERGVYRPGETAHFKFVSRAYEDDRIIPPVGERVKIQITGPRQDVAYSRELRLNEFGSCWDSLHIEKYFPVGEYVIEVKSPPGREKPETFTNSFLVQEFKAQRHYASVSVKREQRSASDFVGLKMDEAYLAVEVKGLYYAGGPVKHGRVRWRVNLIPAVHTVKSLDSFFFGNRDDKTLFLESGESTLDVEGKLTFTVPLDSRLLTGSYAVEISATVLDIDGEPATEVERYNPTPRFLVGIGDHPKRVQSGYSSPIRIVVVDEKGKAIGSGKVDVAVMERRSFFVEKRDSEGNLNPLWEEGWIKTIASQAPIKNGEGSFGVDLNSSGDYLISFTYEAEGSRYSSQTTFQVGWEDYDRWTRNQRDKEVRTSNEVLVSLSRPEYRVGESAGAQFQTPRPVKKCLVTLEKGDILDYKVIEAKSGSVNYQFPIKEAYQPNVYFSVLAVAGRDGFPVYSNQSDSEIPMVYFGYANVVVRTEIKKLNLEIDPGVADFRARPAEKKALALKVTDESGKGVVSEMAVCVVDEAVLALTRYKTPNLSSLTSFNLPLAVFSGDLRMDLVSQDLFRRFSTRPLTGGGVGVGEMSPALRKDFQPVAFYHPAVQTDASGAAMVEFLLPDSITAYRAFAVVCDQRQGFVSGERRLVVNKEFSVEPSLPRFLVVGDKARFPVTLQNRTGEKGRAMLRGEAGPGLKVNLEDAAMEIEPWSSTTVKAFTEVSGGIDQGVVRFRGKFTAGPTAYEDGIEVGFPVNSRYLPIHRIKIGDFTEKIDVDLGLPDILTTLAPKDLGPGDFRAHLSLGFTNWPKLSAGLKYLLNYPFGCVEQTSSGIYPLAGMRGLVEAGLLPGITKEEVDRFIKGGVDRLLSMQAASGGFSYWPGQIDPSWWGSNFAVLALHMARQAGFPIPQDRLDKALKFVRHNLFATDRESGHNRQGRQFQGSQWNELAVLNLALAGMINAQEFNTFLAAFGSMNDQAKGLMLLAAKKTGFISDSRLKEMLKKMEPRLASNRTDYYDSSFREAAICLMATNEIEGTSQKADAWAGYLLRNLKPSGRWVSTADTGWCLLGLSGYFKGKPANSEEKTKVWITYGDQHMTEMAVSDTTAYVELETAKLLKNRSIKMESGSKRLINYTLNLTYPDLVNDPGSLSKGFTLRKKMENLNGSEEIRVGDVVRITLEVGLTDPNRSRGRDFFEYVALEDPVPAGIVPINSELKTEGAQGENESQNSFSLGWNDFLPTYSEFRSNGVRVFKDSAWAGSYRYSYLSRAVAEGEFWMVGSRVSLMYDPNVYGKTAGRQVKILPALR